MERNLTDLTAYEADVMRTAPRFKTDEEFLAWASLGLCEAGEVQNEIKKQLYQGAPYDHEAIIEELGDLFFYMIAIMKNRRITLAEVIDYNVDKRKDFVPGKGRPHNAKG